LNHANEEYNAVMHDQELGVLSKHVSLREKASTRPRTESYSATIMSFVLEVLADAFTLSQGDCLIICTLVFVCARNSSSHEQAINQEMFLIYECISGENLLYYILTSLQTFISYNSFSAMPMRQSSRSDLLECIRVISSLLISGFLMRCKCERESDAKGSYNDGDTLGTGNRMVTRSLFLYNSGSNILRYPLVQILSIEMPSF